MNASAATSPIALGNPVPWFSAPTLAGGSVDLHVDAGRWVVLAFFGADDPRLAGELEALLALAPILSEDRIVAYAVFGAPPRDPARLACLTGPAFNVIADYDGRLAARYGAREAPRTIVLDPMLRAVADIAWDNPAGHAAMLGQLVRSLPEVDAAAGVPLSAPVLIVPRVLDFPFCDLLVSLYDQIGGTDSGFLLDRDGKTATVVNHRLKRRQDMPIAAPELREIIRDRVVARLLPPIERFFQFAATRMDRYLVSCYDSAVGGHFFRHRDNVNAGAQHRRFAVTINLNSDYEGCDLVFPEFGRRTYRAPVGGAIVFSCGALHEVTPIARGRRYAFIPFLYGEEDAERRRANNARLHEGEARYQGGEDRLLPVASPEPALAAE
ncbi:MAG: 2OG-Fe(II) oxygenase [Alphaproteobacteria bacterium]|nr:2OG-Fe(II) oxygenase [Alphaproteobacteria bacterium]